MFFLFVYENKFIIIKQEIGAHRAYLTNIQYTHN